MAKSWKPKLPKAFQPWKPPKQVDPFKILKFSETFKPPKESKPVASPHVITSYERELIRTLTPIIQAKGLIKFWYEDKTTDFEDWRIVEPHLIGLTKYKTASILLSAWFLPTEEQVWKGHQQDWKSYILDDVKKIEILDSSYRLTRPLYNPRDKRMNFIYCATAERVV